MPRRELTAKTHEQSPLLHDDIHTVGNGALPGSGSPTDSYGWADDAEEEIKPWWYLLLLTVCIGGLQIVWSVELGSGSPYLLSLGMSKSVLAFVWLAGPLTGAVVQPYVGMRSDNCRVSWGRRKPFMVGGGIATILSLLALAWAREIVETVALASRKKDPDAVKVGAIVFATAFMWILDFSINTVQAGIRAFIVDNAPAQQQEEANAWASRILGVGNVLGYVFGYLDLPKFLPIFGNTQFKVLSVLASLSLTITVAVSCLAIQEQDPNLYGPPDENNGGVIGFFKETFKSIKRLQPQVRKVCQVQLANWIAWFPFLYYITTFIGQLYVNPYLEENERHHNLTDGDIDDLWQEGTRIGTFTLLIYAITSFTANVILPFLVVPTYTNENTKGKGQASDDSDESLPIVPTSPFRGRPRTPGGRPALPYSNSATSLSAFIPRDTVTSSIRKDGFAGLLNYLRIPGLSLRRLWIFAHLLFAACMFSTFFIRTPMPAAVMTALVGLSWSVSLWAPFALISAEVAQNAEQRRRNYKRKLAHQQDDSSALSSATSPPEHSDEDSVQINEDVEEGEQLAEAGMILGLHNCAISAPQIVATLISSAVFKALQKPRDAPGDDSVGWVLRLSGIAALVAAWLTSRLSEV